MKIVVASDQKNNLTDFIIEYLKHKEHELVLLRDLGGPNEKWAEIGREAGKMASEGKVDQGIFLCWSGTGICMAANRFKGVRAALCWDAGGAVASRKWYNANVLCLSYRYTTEEIAKEIMYSWFSTEFNEEDLKEVHKLDEG